MALSPVAFEQSGDIIPANIAHLDRPDPYMMTNRGFAMDLHVQPYGRYVRPYSFPFQCSRLGYGSDFVVVIVMEGDDWNDMRRYLPREIYVTNVQKHRASRIQKAYISPCYKHTLLPTTAGRGCEVTFKILPSVGLFHSA